MTSISATVPVSIDILTSVKYLNFAWLLPVAVATACSGPTEPQFVPADAAQIRQRTQEYEAAFNAKDAAKVATFYPGEAVFMPPNAPTIRGREDIQKFYVDLIAQGGTDLEMDTKDVRGHGPLAYEAGGYALHRKPANGPALRDRGKYLLIWRHVNGVVDHRVHHVEQRPAGDRPDGQLTPSCHASPSRRMRSSRRSRRIHHEAFLRELCELRDHRDEPSAAFMR